MFGLCGGRPRVLVFKDVRREMILKCFKTASVVASAVKCLKPGKEEHTKHGDAVAS